MMAFQVHLQLDSSSGVPAYRQLMDQIRYYVASGSIAAGDKLPSIRDLARGLGVNPTTVIKAYTELESAGVLDRQQGRGVFVAESASPMSASDVDKALRQSARQLVVEAVQMGVDLERVVRLVRDEFDRMERQQGEDS